MPQYSALSITRLAGFSPTTVSLVLNGRSKRFKISRETQELIRGVAKEHNYYPNLHARGLRSRTTNIVGLTVPTLDNPFFGEMAETFESLARSHKKLPLITVTHYDPREELETINYFLSQKIECVFTANLTALDEISSLCSRAGIQQILLDSQESAKPTVTTDNVQAASVLTRNLLAAAAAGGRKGRLYYVGGMATHAITMQRLSGFRAALAERGAPFSEVQFIQTAFDPEAAYRKLGELLHSTSEVGGLFLNAVPALEGLVRLYPEAPERCRKIPCGVFDYHPFMSLLADLRLLIIRQNPRLMMSRAYEILPAPGPRTRRSTSSRTSCCFRRGRLPSPHGGVGRRSSREGRPGRVPPPGSAVRQRAGQRRVPSTCSAPRDRITVGPFKLCAMLRRCSCPPRRLLWRTPRESRQSLGSVAGEVPKRARGPISIEASSTERTTPAESSSAGRSGEDGLG